MKTKNLFLLSFLMLSLISCERECKLKPIPKNIFDLDKVKNVVVFQSGKEIDSSVLSDKFDDYTKTSYKGPMNYRECEHNKSYEVNFKKNRILVWLRKNDKNILEMQVYAFGNCMKIDDERVVSEKELLLNKEFIFEREKECDSSNSILKKITLKGYLIESIMTSDNKVWILK